MHSACECLKTFLIFPEKARWLKTYKADAGELKDTFFAMYSQLWFQKHRRALFRLHESALYWVGEHETLNGNVSSSCFTVYHVTALRKDKSQTYNWKVSLWRKTTHKSEIRLYSHICFSKHNVWIIHSVVHVKLRSLCIQCVDFFQYCDSVYHRILLGFLCHTWMLHYVLYINSKLWP